MGAVRKASDAGVKAPNLPALRQDLHILPSAPFWTGAPSWIIHDPVANKYFRIGEEHLGKLSHWAEIPSKVLADRLKERSGKEVSNVDVEDLAKFLLTHCLAENPSPEAWKEHLARRDAARQAWWKKLVGSYLFLRIPLVNPQGFLTAVWPLVSFLFTPGAAVILILGGLGALYLVSHQWENFKATFASFLTLEGIMLYGASLLGIKVVHELGHALMATKYRVNVPVIGAALIVLMPILYTDTTAAHRVKSRSQRLHIDLAGIYAELALAVLATWLWILLPDGSLRSVAFTIATLSWVMSLAVNLNPFMRFDGYYILSDLFGIENLQDRGFAIAKWRMREILFGLKSPPPELLPQRWYWPLVLHAWGTWIYRFFLFLGIALLVYAFFIKIIGILLFILEICWFILAPLWRELIIWWAMKDIIMQKKRYLVGATVSVACILLLFLPMRQTVTIPAILKVPGSMSLYPPVDAQLVENLMTENRIVRKGDVLARFVSPDLSEQLLKTTRELALLKARLDRSAADDEELSLRSILLAQHDAKQAEKSGLHNQLDRLTVIAPDAGILVNVDPLATSGVWANPGQKLALIKTSDRFELSGMVNEEGARNLSANAPGKFIPDNPQLSSLQTVLVELSAVSLKTMEEPLLADINGGSVGTIMAKDGQTGSEILKPRLTWYKVRLADADADRVGHYPVDQIIRGIVHLKGNRQSYAGRIGRHVASVLLRELSP